MFWRSGPLILAIVLLTGCSLVQNERSQAPARTESPTATARLQPTTPTRRPAPRATMADLLGADPARIDSYLGAPEIVRREGAGELRLYRSNNCVLHIFLYPRNGTIGATHVEARNDTAQLDPSATERCITSFS